jgi:hypothetical protein
VPATFPGIDPYREAPEIWRGFHHLLAEEIMRPLDPLLGPRYYAGVESMRALEEVRIAATNASRVLLAGAAVLDGARERPRSGTAGAAVAIPHAPARRPVSPQPHEKLRSVRGRESGTAGRSP